MQRILFSAEGVKKDASINRRQVSDLSSASDYSATTQSQPVSTGSNPKNNASSHQESRTTGTRRAQRGGAATASNNTTTNATTTGPHGTKSSAATASTNANSGGAPANKSLGTRGEQTSDLTAKMKGPISALSTKGVTAKSKVGASTVSSHQKDNPSTKSHPAVKPLRDKCWQ